MLMDKRPAFRQTASLGAFGVDREEIWQTCGAQLLETNRTYTNMYATSGVHMISYNIYLANCAATLANCAFTFGYQLHRINTLSDFLQLSSNYTEDCFNTLHRHNIKLTRLAKNAMDELSMPIKVNAILAYGVVR
jgi:hypothetical protein